MAKLTLKHIAWFLPIAYLIHLFDEYFSGEGFPKWFSGVLKASLSSNDFIIINSVGFAATLIIVILYSIDKINNFIIATLGTLFFINGIIHLLASVITARYSPGTTSGLIIYLPLGYLIFKKIFPLMPEQQRFLIVSVSIILQIVVAIIALNI
jgi:hypothetical protein